MAARRFTGRKFVTNADRQKAYRQRKKVLSNKSSHSAGVTRCDKQGREISAELGQV